MIPTVSVTPIRQRDDMDPQIDAVEARLKALDEQLRQLTDASATRIHDFERRLEHEWLALRQLHEDELKHLQQRAVALASAPSPSTPIPADRRQRSDATPAIIVLVSVVVTLAALTGYTRWRLGANLQNATARALAAERRAADVQRTAR